MNFSKKGKLINHPDHLHPETLSFLDKSKTIITAAFKSNSTKKMLKSIGFNPICLDYKDLFQFKNKKICIYIRREALGQLVINNQPWEDASIGFQMRIKRTPNIYNAKFWYHFTNEYVGSENYRYASHCGACNLIDQNPKYV